VLVRNGFRGWGLLFVGFLLAAVFSALPLLTTSMGVSREEHKMNVYIAQTAVRFLRHRTAFLHRIV
jgi:heme/copper-type cytochrome/quinol oxidase subunit 4